MEIHTSIDDLVRSGGGSPIWTRVRDAVVRSAQHPEGGMHSVGDAITYLRTRRRHRGEDFVAHRRYVEIVAAGASPVVLEVASVADLTVREAYSDLSDRMLLHGQGERCRLDPGEIAVIGLDEAVRYPQDAARPATVLHVSVEKVGADAGRRAWRAQPPAS